MAGVRAVPVHVTAHSEQQRRRLRISADRSADRHSHGREFDADRAGLPEQLRFADRRRGNVGTVLTLICHASANDPDPAAAESPVESWALAHAHVQPVLPVDTSGGPGIASVRIQVSPSIRPTHLQRDPWTSDSRVWQGCSGRSSSTVVAVIAPIGTRRPVRRIPERQLWLIAAGRAPWPPSQLVTFSLRVSRLLAASSGVPSA
jgi:hypothetical protein